MGEKSTFHVLDGSTASHALTYGAVRAAKSLDLDRQLLQFMLATDGSVVDQLMGSGMLLDPDSDEGRRALRLVRLHRALGDVFGSAESVQAFLDRFEPEFSAAPRSLLHTPEGVDRVLVYLEARVRDWLP